MSEFTCKCQVYALDVATVRRQSLQDPAAGLGLTLVDGQLNGITGVYVKSVADGGAGQKAVRITVVDRVTVDYGMRDWKFRA